MNADLLYRIRLSINHVFYGHETNDVLFSYCRGLWENLGTLWFDIEYKS